MDVVSLLAMVVQVQVPVSPAVCWWRRWADLPLDGNGRRRAGAGGGLDAGAACALLRHGNAGDAGDLECDPRGSRGVSAAAVQDDWRDCGGAGDAAVCRIPHVGADGAVCDEDGDQLSGGRGVLGAGGLYGDVCLDPGEYPDGFGGARRV